MNTERKLETDLHEKMQELEKMQKRRSLEEVIKEQQLREDIKSLQPLAEELLGVMTPTSGTEVPDNVIEIELPYTALIEAQAALRRITHTPTHTKKASRLGLPELLF